MAAWSGVSRRRRKRRAGARTLLGGVLSVLGLNTGCARIGYDLIEPVPDDGSSQGAMSAGSGAGKGGNSGSHGGTRAGGNAGEPAQGGNGGATASGGTPSGDVGSPTGGTGETNQAGAGAAPAGAEGGETSPGSGRSGNGGTSGTGGTSGIGGTAGIGGTGMGGTSGRSSGGTSGRSGGSAGSGGSASSCVPSESGIERCDGLDNDCSGAIDDAGACSPDCEGHVFAGASYMYCSTNLIPTNAAAACSSENMRLARIDTRAENEFLHQFVVVDTWLGGSDTSIEGRWTWPDGVVFWLGVAFGSAPPGMYAHFDAEEPNDNFGMSPEDCLVLRPNGYWNDKPCSTTLPFMCKRY